MLTITLECILLVQLISNNNVDIPEPFENNKNRDNNNNNNNSNNNNNDNNNNNKNIDEQLFEKNCSITSDDESEFYPSIKKCDTESPPVNANDDISTLTGNLNVLTGSLNNLTVSESVNSDISYNCFNYITLYQKLEAWSYIITQINSWNKAVITSTAGKAKGKKHKTNI